MPDSTRISSSALGGEPLEHGQTFRVLLVERNRTLVAVQVLEIRSLPRPAWLLAAGIVRQRIDLDDIGATVRKIVEPPWDLSGSGSGRAR